MAAAAPPGAAGRAAGAFCRPRLAAAPRRSLTGSAQPRPHAPTLGTGRAGSCPCFRASRGRVGRGHGTPSQHPPLLPWANDPAEGRARGRCDAPRTPRASAAPGRISCAGKGHRCPLARSAPGRGIFGKRLPGSPFPGPPEVISRGGSRRGHGSPTSLPAPNRGNATPGEIAGNHKAEGCGRINPS